MQMPLLPIEISDHDPSAGIISSSLGKFLSDEALHDSVRSSLPMLQVSLPGHQHSLEQLLLVGSLDDRVDISQCFERVETDSSPLSSSRQDHFSV